MNTLLMMRKRVMAGAESKTGLIIVADDDSNDYLCVVLVCRYRRGFIWDDEEDGSLVPRRQMTKEEIERERAVREQV